MGRFSTRQASGQVALFPETSPLHLMCQDRRCHGCEGFYIEFPRNRTLYNKPVRPSNNRC